MNVDKQVCLCDHDVPSKLGLTKLYDTWINGGQDLQGLTVLFAEENCHVIPCRLVACYYEACSTEAHCSTAVTVLMLQHTFDLVNALADMCVEPYSQLSE